VRNQLRLRSYSAFRNTAPALFPTRFSRYAVAVLIDLHCHTRPLSACSSLTVDDLVAGARRAGLDGVCLTEHDRLWPLDEVRRLSDLHGLVILRGMEVTTELGHALVFGLEEPPPAMFLAASLRAAVERAGGVMVLAHPARAGQPAVERAALARLFDAVETANGSDGPEQNRAAGAFARSVPLPGTGGSDCHAPAEIGRCATRLPAPVRTEADLVEVLRLGRHEAVWLDQSPQSCRGR
jgi:predicted metal-dependent phosphoesterase TrpH